jgi:hypothetical protein
MRDQLCQVDILLILGLAQLIDEPLAQLLHAVLGRRCMVRVLVREADGQLAFFMICCKCGGEARCRALQAAYDGVLGGLIGRSRGAC